MSRDWVYENAARLEARRLGTGPRARLRFDLARVTTALAPCSEGRGSAAPAAPVLKPKRRRSTPGRLGSGVVLLPIRGVRGSFAIGDEGEAA